MMNAIAEHDKTNSLMCPYSRHAHIAISQITVIQNSFLGSFSPNAADSTPKTDLAVTSVSSTTATIPNLFSMTIPSVTA